MSHQTVPDPSDRSTTGYRWIILILTTLSQTSISVISQGVPTLAPFFRSAFDLTTAQVGLLSSSMNVGSILTVMPSGRAVDILGERRVIGMGGLLAGLSVIGAALAPSFATTLACLSFSGLWLATSTPAGSKAVMTWFDSRNRALAMGIRQTGIPLGGTIAALALPAIAYWYSWRAALLTTGFIAILGSGSCYLGYREPGARAGHSLAGRPAPLVQLLRNRSIVATSLVAFVLVSGQYILVTYLILYLKETLATPLGVASGILALAQAAAVAGRVSWGRTSDRAFGGSRKTVIVLVALLASGASLALAALTPRTPVWLVALVAALFGFTIIGWNGLYVTLISELAGPDSAGTALGFSLTAVQMGIVVAPPLFGHLVDVTGSYRPAWVLLAAALAASTLLLYFVREQPRAD